jgi:hypothetical protein
MTVWLVAAWALAVGACVAEPEPELGEIRAASLPIEGQGQDLQGQDFQGQDFQGTDPQGRTWQGVMWEGVSLSGVTHGGVAASDASVNRTVLEVWTPRALLVKLGWRQRLPDRYCDWSADRSTLIGCTEVNLRTSPSPLAGTTWIATFRPRGGTAFQRRIQIGRSTTDVGAVRRDSTYAMHPLEGDSSAAACDIKPCDNPDKCRQNCDLWRYDITFPEWPDAEGQPRRICRSGESAMAFSGTWDAQGTFVPGGGNFTFGCTNGVIAKCARWGYRPFGVGWPAGDLFPTAMAPYHQACLRAASADYCGIRHSFTRNGTLIDIFDGKFVPSAQSLFTDVTALAWESRFNPLGGVLIDHLRYQELAHVEGNEGFDVTAVCPGRFSDGRIPSFLADTFCPTGSDTCLFTPGEDPGPMIAVSSARACAHTEQTVGKWLNQRCHSCVAQVPDHCSDPDDPRGWDAACVAAASACGNNTMATHSECTTGKGLNKYDTGCTLAVCLDSAYASCCNPAASSWSSQCVAAANEKCTGGREGYHQLGGRQVWFGFCGGLAPDPPPVAQ